MFVVSLECSHNILLCEGFCQVAHVTVNCVVFNSVMQGHRFHMSLNICDLSNGQLVHVLHFRGVVFCVCLIVQQNQISYPPFIYGGHIYDKRCEENNTESLTLKERENKC